MTRLYEGMFLIDNDAVRAGWRSAKGAVTELLAKHGGSVQTARRWGERRLAYPIHHRNRATYLLTHFETEGESIPALIRDLELSEVVLRHLIVRAEAVPDEERQLAAAEEADDFVVPEPPADDVVEVAGRRGEEDDSDDSDDGDDSSSDDDSDEEGSGKEDSKAEPAMAGGRKDDGDD